MSSGWAVWEGVPVGCQGEGSPRVRAWALNCELGLPPRLFPPHPYGLAQGQQPPHTSGTLALATGVVTTIRARRWAKLLEV